jgi:hypothetical protein
MTKKLAANGTNCIGAVMTGTITATSLIGGRSRPSRAALHQDVARNVSRQEIAHLLLSPGARKSPMGGGGGEEGVGDVRIPGCRKHRARVIEPRARCAWVSGRPGAVEDCGGWEESVARSARAHLTHVCHTGPQLAEGQADYRDSDRSGRSKIVRPG